LTDELVLLEAHAFLPLLHHLQRHHLHRALPIQIRLIFKGNVVINTRSEGIVYILHLLKVHMISFLSDIALIKFIPGKDLLHHAVVGEVRRGFDGELGGEFGDSIADVGGRAFEVPAFLTKVAAPILGEL